jgi:hypothetical protein
MLLVAVPGLLLAGAALARDGRPSPLDPGAKAPTGEFRSAFEGYRPFADRKLADWRKANEQVGAAGSKREPGKAEGPGRGGHHK